jgi:hypothetical protein
MGLHVASNAQKMIFVVFGTWCKSQNNNLNLRINHGELSNIPGVQVKRAVLDLRFYF